MSAPSAGAETSTRLAPAVRWAAALSLAVKMPVHSSAISTPRSFHGSVDGSRSAVTLIGAVADDDGVALDGHFAGEAAMHGVEAQQVGVGLDRAEIVDARPPRCPCGRLRR